LIGFARLNALPMLIQTLGSIVVPHSVVDECLGDTSRAGANVIQAAIADKTLPVHPDPVGTHVDQLTSTLGPGESAAIILALQLEAGLLIDDKCARSTAKRLNIKIIGSAGALLLAKKKGLIPAIMPTVRQLQHVGYYLSNDLIVEVAKLAGEDLF
jgi:predicted nucleic acid-binding protein